MQWKVCRLSNKLAPEAVRWQEDKYAQQQQQTVAINLKSLRVLGSTCFVVKMKYGYGVCGEV